MTKSKMNPLLTTTYPRFGNYELIIFIFLLLEFIALTYENTLSSQVRTYYLLTYKFGFGSNMLIGSIVSLFSRKITNHVVFVTGVIAFVILILLISLILGGVIRRSQQALKSATIIFVVLFLASPLSVTYLLGANFPRLDIYWLVITILALFILKRPVLCYFVPLLCALAMLVHQGYIITYMPALVILLLYEVYKNKYSKKSIAIFIFSSLCVIILFIVFQLFPNSFPFSNAVDFADYLSKNAGFKADTLLLYGNYFSPFTEMLKEYVLPLTLLYALPFGIVLLTFSLPIIIVFGTIWKSSIRNVENKFLKFVFILCSVAPLAFIPIAVLGNDWDRWWAAIINNQFILVFYFIYSNETVVVDIVKKIGDFFDKRFLLLLLIIIFTNSLTFSKTVILHFALLSKSNIPYSVVDFIKKSYII